MLSSVLTKLIECMNEHNKYVLAGPPMVANHYVSKCELLIECLEDAGYKPKIATELVEITEGLYRGCRGNLYNSISIDVPGASADDINAFKSVGFEWLFASNVMKYKFEKNGKEKKAV